MAGSECILVVDDSPDNLNLLSRWLVPRYHVKVASSGQLALSLAHTDPIPDLILLDVMMPGMDGYTVCKRLKADRATRDIPVIFLTARNQVEDEAAGFAAGAVDFLSKPVDQKTLWTHVNARLSFGRQCKIHRQIGQAAVALLARQANQMDAAIEGVLALGGHMLFADRAYLMLYSNNRLSIERGYEWCAPGIESARTLFEGWSLQALPWWSAQIAKRECVALSDVAALPDAATPEHALFDAAGTRSLCAFPIQARGQTFGFIGFDSVHRERPWSIDDEFVVELMADLFAIALARWEAETELRVSEEKYRSLVETTAEGFWLLDAKMQTRDTNAALCRLLSVEREALLGKTPFDFLDDHNRHILERETSELTNGEQRAFELTFTRRNDSPLHTLCNMTRLHDRAGDISGSFMFMTDISERRQAEDNLKLAASVFTHAREGIAITDAEGTLIEVNEAFTHITGYERDEIVGNNPRILQSGRQGPDFYREMWKSLIDEGHWSGEIWNRRKDGSIFPELLTISAVHGRGGEVHHYVSLHTDISAQKAHEKRLEQIAHHDALTGLPNRILLTDRVNQAMAAADRQGSQLAIAYLDLDGFKEINDQHGHDIGDELLVALAQRMRDTMRGGDTIARLGGDEFVVVMLDLPAPMACLPLLTRLLAACARPFAVADHLLSVSSSVGVTFYPQEGEVDADQLMRQADQAMYRAKLSGKNCYQLFDPIQNRSLQRYTEGIERIHKALRNGELELRYRPTVDMCSGQLIGAEAILHWHHPFRGLLAASDLLPGGERYPLAAEFGDWAIDAALAQLERWRANGFELPAISVNMGSYQLHHDLPRRLGDLLATHPDLSPAILELEIQQPRVLEDVARITDLMQACQRLGVQFTLDHFGTGCCPFAKLKSLLPFHIKIDRRFVRGILEDPEDVAVIEGALGFSEAVQRRVIAEGVETLEQGAFLLQLGCRLAQGTAIAEPMPADALPGWAASWHPPPIWSETLTVRREDLPLLSAVVEQKAWLRAVELSIESEREPPRLDGLRARFGRWLESTGKARYGDHPLIEETDRLHRRLEEVIRRLAERKRDDGDRAPTQALLGELRHLAELIQSRLNTLARMDATDKKVESPPRTNEGPQTEPG